MNNHHGGGYHSQDEVDQELLGRGKGDPDIHGYPGKTEDIVLTRAEELEQAKAIIEQFAPKGE